MVGSMSPVLNRLVVALALVAAPMAAAGLVTEVAHASVLTVTSDRTSGLPGLQLGVKFSYKEYPVHIEDCEAHLDGDWKQVVRCDRSADSASRIMVLPKELKAGDHTVHWTVGYRLELNAMQPYQDPDQGPDRDTGAFNFTVFEAAFDAVADPPVTNPAQPVALRFASRAADVAIKGCRVVFGRQVYECQEARDGWSARLPAPDVASFVRWMVDYTGGPGTDDTAVGSTEVRVVPWPAPEFRVAVAGSDTVAPGAPVTVQFESLTAGVRIKDCGTTYRQRRIGCGQSHLTVVSIPGDAEAGTVELPWDLTYESSRRGEKGDRKSGLLKITVVVEEPDFTVTVQPPAARPRETVTLAFTSLVPGVDIVGCIAFFPHAPGNTCQRSPERWFVRTKVPADTQPGATLLRWGVASVSTAGRAGADDDVIPYTVLPPLVVNDPTKGIQSGGTTGSTNGTSTASSTGPTKDTTSSDTTSRESTTQATTTTTTLGPTPEFVAETKPESARPRARVVVTVSPLDPDVRILGCAIAFATAGDRACRRSGGRWSAGVTVPADATAGETLPLAWRVVFQDAAGRRGTDNGTIDYLVQADVPYPPAFEVVADPAAATPGKRVTVSHTPLDADVAITGCRAGFTEKAMTACRQSPSGWVADVEVPPATSPGPSRVFWTVAYTRPGEAAGATEGLSSFRVLPPVDDHRGRLRKATDLLWRTVLGGVLLVGLLAVRGIRKPILDRLRGRRAAESDDDRGIPESVRIVPVFETDRMSVLVDRSDAAPAQDIRILTRRPRLAPRVPEEFS
jgi:hypothetical protein